MTAWLEKKGFYFINRFFIFLFVGFMDIFIGLNGLLIDWSDLVFLLWDGLWRDIVEHIPNTPTAENIVLSLPFWENNTRIENCFLSGFADVPIVNL